MFKKIIALILLAFVAGWLAHAILVSPAAVRAESVPEPKLPALSISEPQKTEPAAEPVRVVPSVGNRERASPSDRLALEDVHVTNSRVTIDAPRGRRFETAIFTNTNSMDPLIDEGSQAIQIVPVSTAEITIGDIISYDAGQYGTIIHRVVEIGSDEQGWYAIVKGDNNPASDPIKVRFSMIKRVLVGVLY